MPIIFIAGLILLLDIGEFKENLLVHSNPPEAVSTHWGIIISEAALVPYFISILV